jgi:hypothetical protein
LWVTQPPELLTAEWLRQEATSSYSSSNFFVVYLKVFFEFRLIFFLLNGFVGFLRCVIGMRIFFPVSFVFDLFRLWSICFSVHDQTCFYVGALFWGYECL